MKSLSLLLSLIFSTSLIAGDGPAYSKLGIGIMPQQSPVSMSGMAGAGSALFNPSYLNIDNPTQWLSSSTTRIMSGFSYEGISEKGSGGSNFYSNVNFNGFLFTFPVMDKMAFGLGISPYTQNNYTFKTQNKLTDGTQYTTEYFGSGGLSRFSLGGAFRYTDQLILGARVDVIFGTIAKNREVTFGSLSGANSILTESYELSGATMSFSGHYLAKTNVWKSGDKLFYSGSLDLPSSLHGTYKLAESSAFINDTTSTSLNTTLSLPFAIKLAVGYQQDEHFMAAIDFHYTRSSSVKFKDILSDELSDQFAIKAGIAYNPSDAIGSYYYERMTYRAGITFGQSNIVINNTKQDELGLGVGIGLPLPSLSTRLDVSGEFVMKGYLYNTSYKDKIFKVNVGINLSELWFQERIID